MKIRLITLLAVLLCCMTASAQTDSVKGQSGNKILIAYFSWGGNTQHVAEHIASLTGGTLFRIEPELLNFKDFCKLNRLKIKCLTV